VLLAVSHIPNDADIEVLTVIFIPTKRGVKRDFVAVVVLAVEPDRTSVKSPVSV
jgi:hypothetical protein